MADRIHLKEESITFKELLPIVLAYAVWGEEFTGSRVIVHCDNIGAVELVNSLTLLPIFHFQIELWAVHVPGTEN